MDIVLTKIIDSGIVIVLTLVVFMQFIHKWRRLSAYHLD